MTTRTQTRHRVRQKAKGPVDPTLGRRVRSLRVARGMTQAQLAGSDFTKGFISLVESGRTRMSLRAAGIIASGLGVAVSELLSTEQPGAGSAAELLILQAEGHFSAGRMEQVLEAVGALDAEVTGVARARLLRLRGRALTESGRSKEAILSLDEALRQFRAGGQRDLAARTLYDLSLAHAAAEAHGEALNLALQCEQAILAADVVDRTLELKVVAFLAALFIAVGDLTAADLRSERARALAQDVGDPRALADLYENLTVTRQRQGDLDSALNYARLAIEAYEQMGRTRDVGSTWNTIACVYMQRGQSTRAADALGKAESIAQETGDSRLMGFVLQSRAELELANGKHGEAIRLAQQSIDLERVSPRCRALSLLLKARALARSDAPVGTLRSAFGEAANALEPFGPRVAARAYTAQFEAFNDRGLHRDASAAAKRAFELAPPGSP